ncbi:MAG: hypothetical protein HFE34_03275 [Clostridia bacterium]|nr:hypothetical protein [Clostridia bacterium]
MAGMGKKGVTMSDFRYVTKATYSDAMEDLKSLIHRVQDEVRDKFTFRYDFIGSVARNMVTMDYDSNVGYDFDVNIRVNDDDENYTAEDIKRILKNAFDKFNHLFKYDYSEDSTRVLTIKVKDTQHSKILHSADFAVVYDCSDGRQKYIHFNKKQQSYGWQYQPKSYYELDERITLIKKHNLWQEVRDLYIYKKNNNFIGKKSRALFAETVNDIIQQNFE